MKNTYKYPLGNLPMAVLLSFLILLFVGGCASVGTEMDMASMDRIKKGETSRVELVEWYGSPYTVGLNDNGEPTATWMYSEARNTPGNFVPVYNLFAMKMNTRLQQLVVIFDENEVVKSFTFNESNSNTRSGVNHD